MTSDVWICGSCRSVNTRRSGQCYACHAWREAVAVAPADVGSLISVVSQGTAAPAPVGHRYRSARWRALAASILIIAIAVTLPVLWWYTNRSLGALQEGNAELANSIAAEERPILIGYAGLVILAFVAWAAWLSRVVDNLPALGVGYSRATPRMAFIESVIPVFNLFRLPARVREVTRLLHPQGGGDGLIAAAWLVMFAGWVILAVGFRLLVAAQMIDESADPLPTFSALRAIALGSTSIGLLIVVAVIRRVEALAEARTRDLAPAGTDAAAAPLSLPVAMVPDSAPGTGGREPSWRAGPASTFAAGRTVQFLAGRAAAGSPRAGSDAEDWDEPSLGHPAPNSEASPDEPEPGDRIHLDRA